MIDNPVPAYFSDRDGRNYRKFGLLAMASATLFLAATLLLAERYLTPGPVAAALAGVTIVTLLLTVRSYVEFLRGADELLQRIHAQALALGFGAGVVFMPGYRLLERLGAPKLDVNDGLFVMMLFFILGLNRGYKRYAGEAE